MVQTQFTDKLRDTIKIAFADDHDIFRNALASVLQRQDGMAVVISSVNGSDVLKQLENQPVDLVLLDLDMPIMNGGKALRYIRKVYGNRIKVIVLSMHHGPMYVRKYMQDGANAYLDKFCSPEELIRAIRTVMRLGVYYSPKNEELREKIESCTKEKHEFLKGEALSEREKQICSLICKGLSCPEIARKLHLSHRTAENHKRNIFKKLGVSSCTAMMEEAIKKGYYEIEF